MLATQHWIDPLQEEVVTTESKDPVSYPGTKPDGMTHATATRYTACTKLFVTTSGRSSALQVGSRYLS